MLNIINKGMSYKSAEVISELFKSYVRPHLQYCTQFWTPINVKDANMVEGVQRKATKKNSKFKKPIIRIKIEKAGYIFSKA